MARKPGPGGGSRRLTEKVKTARGRKLSSTRWLERQLNDPYVAEAKAQGWRSRAAFKLLQIDEKFGLLRKGGRIVDLGAAPGGWSQVAAAATGEGGYVLAVDILEMEPIPGVEVMQLDFTEADADAKVRERLGGPADVVLSDMAQPATGHRQTDHLRIMAMAELALDFAAQVLKPGGAFAVKLLQGGGENDFLNRVKRDFRQVRFAKPDASRKGSAESYMVATGFRGGDDTEQQ
ncbi:MAG: 23S rRNA methyltransferase [Rhizobiales bacterium NRL2]|jgi:23S rRNA (uridine2552-2'-O)-methyltransferase|nr:MAG: 23S rRNA methyltransferase [Rhizobiales bacterium NRL2]